NNQTARSCDRLLEQPERKGLDADRVHDLELDAPTGDDVGSLASDSEHSAPGDDRRVPPAPDDLARSPAVAGLDGGSMGARLDVIDRAVLEEDHGIAGGQPAPQASVRVMRAARHDDPESRDGMEDGLDVLRVLRASGDAR